MKDKIDVHMAQLAAIDQSMLTPLVRRALRRDAIEIDSWECDQLHGGAGEGNAVYRFKGKGYEDNKEISWSLILKTIHPGDNNRETSARNYYRREPNAYQSGWLVLRSFQNQYTQTLRFPADYSLHNWLL